jgi:AbrB family looped-hinge helix DNA binding protein
MASATVTSKGQIIIPKPIREVLELEAGDRFAFRLDEEGRVILEAETLDLMHLFGALKPAVRGVTLEDMRQAIRSRVAAR